jgi:hypothetical protein
MERRTLFVGLLLVLITFVGVVGLKVAEGWIFGVSPRDQYLRLIHSDTPPLQIPVQLEQGVPAASAQSRCDARVHQGDDDNHRP